MNQDRWQKVKTLFDSVVELSPDERYKILDRACRNDDDLRREVESLIDSYHEADSFMEKPSVAEVASLILETKKLETGKNFGHYEILSQIGVGGMGEVYLAQDKKLDRRVAIKILNEKFSRYQSNLKRFIQEAKAASALNHPNILVIHEIGEAEAVNFIVSEFIEGETLREVIKKTPLKLSEVLDISIQIANALVAAHQSHIVHRDIKPENIIVRPDGYVKVLDFGLAKLVEQKAIGFETETEKQNQTARGIILGTINYMSPEQAKGEKIDAQTDIFSFGTLIYEMLAGRTPFAGDSRSETFANLINAEPQPLSRLAANVPHELQKIVAKTLRKKKEERYQTMKELLTDLKNLRENLAFDKRLEKYSSEVDENATAVLQGTTGDVNNRTNETNTNFIERLRRIKSLTASVLVVLLVAAVGLSYYFWSASKTSLNPNGKKSLAVLPFVNAGQDANAEYLSDGITESIINNLSQISGLRVMSRNSAFRFKHNQTETKNIASQLGVETLVTGDIKQLGDKLIINVRLINASDDTQVWGHQYVKTSTDVIAAQNEIAQAVAHNLRLKLTNSEQKQLGKKYTENPEAYQLYLRGRFHNLKSTEPEILKSIDFYQKAIEIDPGYALAYVGIADAYRTLAIAGWNAVSKEAFPQSKAAVNKALEIDPNLAEAHVALGWAGFSYDWDWVAAEKELKIALELAPDSSDAHRAYAHLLSNAGRHDEAIAESRRARELDPLSLITNALEGQFLFFAGQEAQAIDRLQKTLELEPNFWIAHNALGRVYLHQGRYEKALAEFNIARELSGGGSTVPITGLAYALAKSGNQEKARAILEELKAYAREKHVSAHNFAVIYNGLGEREEAFKYLEKSFQEREVDVAFIKVDRRWDNLRSEPRFIELISRLKFE